MSKQTTQYEPSYNVFSIEIKNATSQQANILKMILTNEAKKMNKEIKII